MERTLNMAKEEICLQWTLVANTSGLNWPTNSINILKIALKNLKICNSHDCTKPSVLSRVWDFGNTLNGGRSGLILLKCTWLCTVHTHQATVPHDTLAGSESKMPLKAHQISIFCTFFKGGIDKSISPATAFNEHRLSLHPELIVSGVTFTGAAYWIALLINGLLNSKLEDTFLLYQTSIFNGGYVLVKSI